MVVSQVWEGAFSTTLHSIVVIHWIVIVDRAWNMTATQAVFGWTWAPHFRFWEETGQVSEPVPLV